MLVTREQLLAVMPFAKQRMQFLEPLNAAMEEFSINNPKRISAFLAQIAHESGQLRYVKELASGAEYDVGKKALALGNTPEDDDDGEMYKGRGLIQITGTANYKAVGEHFGVEFLWHPELLEEPEWACRSAAWFWWRHGLNEMADAGDFRGITRRINGGYNGLADREAYYSKARSALRYA